MAKVGEQTGKDALEIHAQGVTFHLVSLLLIVRCVADGIPKVNWRDGLWYRLLTPVIREVQRPMRDSLEWA